MPKISKRESIHHEIPTTQGINITPLIDVVFQLLIFFMIASSLVKPNQIELELPESTSGTKSAEQSVLTVVYRLVEGNAQIMLNEDFVDSLDSLTQILAEYDLADGDARPQVDILIDKTVPTQQFISVMDAVRDAGFIKFSFKTLAPSQSAKAVAAEEIHL